MDDFECIKKAYIEVVVKIPIIIKAFFYLYLIISRKTLSQSK